MFPCPPYGRGLRRIASRAYVAGFRALASAALLGAAGLYLTTWALYHPQDFEDAWL